jgi:oligoendopeptidase F
MKKILKNLLVYAGSPHPPAGGLGMTGSGDNPLPRWNLSDFYASPKDPRLEEDLKTATQEVLKFAQRVEGKITTLSAEALANAITDYEHLQERYFKVFIYANLLFAEDMSNGDHAAFFQDIKEKVTDISQNLLFFTLELNAIEDETLNTMLQQNKTLQRFEPWIRQTRAFKPYQLSKDLEKLLHEKDIGARANWVRLYDETFAALRFPFNDEELPISDILNLMSDKDPKIRELAAKSFARGLQEKSTLMALITNTLAKDKDITDRWRHYPSSVTERHLDNQVEEEVVDALVSAVKKAYPRLSHRYYKLKAQWMGKETLPYWDRNAPLPQENDTLIPWEEAKEIVLEAYGAFSPTLQTIGKQFFDKHWIDATLTPGKDSGAFSHPTVPSVHPYILMNYHGKVRDVMTLAHELGHGVHQWLARDQGLLLSETPLTIAETASVFGEMLTFQSLMARTLDPLARKTLLAGKVEDMLNTVVRQIAFFDFERQVHAKRKEKELTVEELGKIWMQVQHESLGEAITLDPEYQYFWSYISHFIHAPFYVYAYAFGDCLVNSLYAVYKDGSVADFEHKYLDLLKYGGTKRHHALVAPFGLDTRQPAFWDKGLEMIEGFIDELER